LERLGLEDRVSLAGAVDAVRLEGLYHRADLFVLATRFEGYGMAAAEALAHGLAVVSTRTGALSEIVPEAAGVLVPPGDRRALSESLARLMDDPQLRLRLSGGARLARKRLPSWEDACRRMARSLSQALR
jgi:glycosyltransferase involved in cell wall biosynthesis